MRNDKCDLRLSCDDYKHNHCDGCYGNDIKKSICINCRLRAGDYCFCGDKPEMLNNYDYAITECDYFYSRSSYDDFIDGYEHCNKMKNIALHKTVQKLLNRIKELERGDENE